ncbi:hypothetical protein [Kordiimonas sp.]|uniref:hypothetical protein n=1 Tax=Kordiimonas sp. TaxID=1970157 RepID=UPI003A90DDD6
MALPSIGLGEGASFSFGADGGPIHSQETFNTGFETGAFGTKGASPVTTIALVAGTVLATGFVLWALSSLNR